MTPIGTLGLEPYTTKLLVAGGIKTVEDLTQRTPGELRRIGNFARRHLNEVRAALQKKGKTLAAET